MNAIHFLLPTSPTARTATKPADADRTQLPVTTQSRHLHRERDFGIGYGNSSGYASRRRYTSSWAPSQFTFG
jgi:hypothetical protein